MLHYPDEWRAGSPAEPVRFRPTVDGAPLSGGPAAALSLFLPGGGESAIVGQAMDWNAEAGRFEAGVDLSDVEAWPCGGGYRAQVTVRADEVEHVFGFEFGVYRDPWRPNLMPADLAPLAPAAVFEAAATPLELRGLIGEAEEQVRLSLLARGRAPALFADKAGLDRAHRLLALSLLYLRLSSGGDEAAAKAQAWQSRYEQALTALLTAVRGDLDQDGRADPAAANLATVRLEP